MIGEPHFSALFRAICPLFAPELLAAGGYIAETFFTIRIFGKKRNFYVVDKNVEIRYNNIYRNGKQ